MKYLKDLETKEFFQNVAFLESGDIALSIAIWDKSTLVSIRNTKKLFEKEEHIISEYQFLAKNSKETWFLRSPKGCLYGSTTKKHGIKLAKANMPEPLLQAIKNKVASIVPTYREEEEKTMKKAITEHYNTIYAEKLAAQGRNVGKKRIASFDLESTDTDDLLSESFYIVIYWAVEKKTRLINMMKELEREDNERGLTISGLQNLEEDVINVTAGSSKS